MKYPYYFYVISRHKFSSVSMEINFKISCQDRSRIFSLQFDFEYHDDISCNNEMLKISRLATLFATVTWHDFVQNGISANAGLPTSINHHDHVFQLFIMSFTVSAEWCIKCNIMRFKESVSFAWYQNFNFIFRLKMDKEGRWYSVVVFVVSMSNYTVLTPYDNHWYDLNNKFAKPATGET